MGLLNKVVEIGNNMNDKQTEVIVTMMPKPDGRLHTAVVGVNSGFEVKQGQMVLDGYATNNLDALVGKMAEKGLEVVSITGLPSGDDYRFLITYR